MSWQLMVGGFAATLQEGGKGCDNKGCGSSGWGCCFHPPNRWRCDKTDVTELSGSRLWVRVRVRVRALLWYPSKKWEAQARFAAKNK